MPGSAGARHSQLSLFESPGFRAFASFCTWNGILTGPNGDWTSEGSHRAAFWPGDNMGWQKANGGQKPPVGALAVGNGQYGLKDVKTGAQAPASGRQSLKTI